MKKQGTTTQKIVNYCIDFLQVNQFNDYCPNGLQVQGKTNIEKIVTGVTASQALIDASVKANADLLLVHHGFFWKGENQVLTGIKYQRIKRLMDADINLLAFHLPLDAHKEIGNNVLLAKLLGIKIDAYFGQQDIAVVGSVVPTSGQQLLNKLHNTLSRFPLHIPADKEITRIALCTGAAHSYIEQAIEVGADAFISGEISENTVHIARENNIHYFAAGHHASECFGVNSLGEHLAQKFSIDHQFININNPV